jgi:hypothetical protein
MALDQEALQRSLLISLRKEFFPMGASHAGRYLANYCVSIQKQGKSGLGLEAQRQAVRDHLNGGTWKLIAEFTEVESGKRGDQPS